jgi:hypothetical protein
MLGFSTGASPQGLPLLRAPTGENSILTENSAAAFGYRLWPRRIATHALPCCRWNVTELGHQRELEVGTAKNSGSHDRRDWSLGALAVIRFEPIQPEIPPS